VTCAASVEIRVADEGDVPGLAELGERAFLAAFGPTNEPEPIEAYVAEAFSVATLAAQVADRASTWLIATDDEVLVGFAHLERGDAPAEVGGHQPVQLVRLYSEPRRIGTGVGAALMRSSIDRAVEAGHDMLWLGVWEHNDAAIRFYQRWGFEQVGTVAFRLGDEDQTDLVLARRL
jgi:diamine N-acetyltransferase